LNATENGLLVYISRGGANDGSEHPGYFQSGQMLSRESLETMQGTGHCFSPEIVSNAGIWSLTFFTASWLFFQCGWRSFSGQWSRFSEAPLRKLGRFNA
jgi:hypothetical protein